VTRKSATIRKRKSPCAGRADGKYCGSRSVEAKSATPIQEIDILWLTAGLGCDGDTIAMTGATQPSIEDVVIGALPWIPKVSFYNPFLAYEVGDDFVKPFRDAADVRRRLPKRIATGGLPCADVCCAISYLDQSLRSSQ